MTIFVDASAIVAITMEEAGFEPLSDRLSKASPALTSPIAIYEAVTAISRIRQVQPEAAERELLESLEILGIAVTTISPQDGAGAVAAFARYGKGRHRAALNMGDCFSYACARRLGVPLLYKGDDFALTDIPSALDH
jgi:ribonuclease VapC